MADKSTRLDVAIAELSVLLKAAVQDIAEIKNRLSIMDEQFARKEVVDKLAAENIELRNKMQTADINLAVAVSQFRTWGIVGGILVTLIAAFISALQIHL